MNVRAPLAVTGFRRAVVRVLCLLVLPFAVVAGTTGVAEAATHYGDVVQIEHIFGDSEFGGVNTDVMTCSANVYYAIPTGGASTAVIGEGTCHDGWSVLVNEGDSGVMVSFRGVVAGTSSPCLVAGAGLDNLDGWHFNVLAQTSGLCDVTEACWTADVHTHAAPDEFYEDQCEPISLGPLPEYAPLATCAKGDVLSVAAEVDYANNRWRLTITWAGTVDPAANFMFRGYLAGRTAVGSPGDQRWNYDHAVQVLAGTTTTGWQAWNLGPTYSFGAFEILPWNFTPSPDTPPGSLAIMGGPSYLGPLDTPANGGPGSKGYTNVAMCAWWFGPKAYNDPLTEFDEPASNLGAPPSGGNTTDPDPGAPTDDGGRCDFSLTNPVTWVSAGICELVGLVGRLITTVKNLPGMIADAIGGLFQPEPGYLEDKFGEVQDAMGDTAPGKWLTALDLETGSVSGCEGMPLNVDMPGDVEINEHLGAACSGPAASAASLVKIALSVVLVVAGAMTCLRAVGSGFGWSPKGGDA